MTAPEILRDVLLVGGGAVILKVLDMIRDAISAPGKSRRREVDTLATGIKERDTIIAALRAEVDGARSTYRKLIEAYHELRVWVIRTGKHDPDDVPDLHLE
ncbi:MAG: hypothetical protein WC829_03380 [Hyphomicrobium sp.]|jgi:hypothetical protein